MSSLTIKPSLLLGVASTATQIDGGELNHTWNDWFAQGKIKDGSNPAVAATHWERWKQDILLMHRMGVQTYRFSIEWARVEPEDGQFDEEAISHIKEELMLIIGMGMKPLITLHHFSNPMWFEEKGGWEKYDNVRSFLIYVEHMVKTLGHLASEYITIEEANAYAVNGYTTGMWPPGKKNMGITMTVLSNMASAHIKAYRLIHDVRRSLGFSNTKVSFINQQRVFIPKNRLNPVHQTAAKEAERLYQGILNEAMMTGEFHRPLKNVGRDRKGTFADFHAVNYYTRSTVNGLKDGVREGCEKSDLGWEIYPDGIVYVCKKLTKLRPMPIYITGNGVCDLSDSFRCRFIYEHLNALIESKLPVKRYYYDSFLDGFGWLDGNYAKFGLVSVDGSTMERKLKQSGEFYGKMIRNREITEEMFEQYIQGTEYHL